LATTDDIFTKAKGLTFKSIRDDSVKVTKFVVNPLTDVDQEITFLLFLTLRDRAQTQDCHHGRTCRIPLSWKSKISAAIILNFGKCQYIRIGYLHQIWWEDTLWP